MAYTAVLQGTPTWLPMIALDANTGSPRTGITFNQVDVSFKKSSQATFQAKVIGSGDFRENGSGVYEVLFSGSELNVIGTFLYIINSNNTLPLPAIRQVIGEAVIQSSSTYTPGTITLDTNILTGNLVDLRSDPMVGESVSARVLEAPAIIGVSPNRGGIGTQIISTKTDQSGFFALEVIRGSIIDVVIPSINYRRTLTVPNNASDRLFDIP